MSFAKLKRIKMQQIQMFSEYLRVEERRTEVCLRELENPEISSEDADFLNYWLRRAQSKIERLRNHIKSLNDEMGETAG